MKQYLIATALSLVLFSCKNNTSGSQAENVRQTAGSDQPSAAFMDFYQKFHSDSRFQLDHIVWPLAGQTAVQVDSSRSILQAIQWEKEKWRMHRLDFNSNDYLREWKLIGDIMVIEKMRAKSANYGLERRFAKKNDTEWALIFYSDMHEL